MKYQDLKAGIRSHLEDAAEDFFIRSEGGGAPETASSPGRFYRPGRNSNRGYCSRHGFK